MAKPEKRRRRERNGLVETVNALLSLFVFALLIVVAITLFGVQRFNADGPSTEDQVFAVARGAGTSSVASNLNDQGLISNSFFSVDQVIFQVGARLTNNERGIRAGEYNIPAGSSMADILKELTEGRAINYSVTIPEGWTSWEAAQRINEAELLTGDPISIPPEGTLLPNTYSFERGTERSVIVAQMTEAMQKAVAEVWEGRDPDLPISSPEELVILASIVEKETGIASERPMVAAVFVNRLNRGMRLQSDPTIIYGITEGQGPLGRGLRASEIEQATPYNTYQIDGLPVGPIANPGIEALMAVAHPAESDAVFFVAAGATPDLGHVFANTLDEHNRNVAAYRRAVAEYEAEVEAARQAAEQAAAEAAEAGADENTAEPSAE